MTTVEPRPTSAGEWMLLAPMTKYVAKWERGLLILRNVEYMSYGTDSRCFRDGLGWVKLTAKEQTK